MTSKPISVSASMHATSNSVGVLTKRHSLAIVALALVAGFLLRLWFVAHSATIAGDTLLYADIAKNWLDHGVYGFTQSFGRPHPTLIRLPGYPAFLALCFSLFGREHYTAVMYTQVVLDLITCLIVAALAGRLFGPRAFKFALWFSALCPFTANYAATPLAETITLTSIAVAFYALHRWLSSQNELPVRTPYNRWLYLLAASLSYSILLRPEQGLLAAAILPAMFWASFRPSSPSSRSASPIRRSLPVLLVAILTIFPLVPWTVRNWHTLHVFQPLAPRYATDPGETVPFGFQRWYRTWAIDFTSTEDVYWNYDGAPIEISDLPSRAFDNDSQYARTEALLAEYDETSRASAALDDRFSALAAERIRLDPVRYYIALPVARLLDMILRPRTELLPIQLDWWRLSAHRAQTIFSAVYAVVNLAYFVIAGSGLRRWKELARDGASWNGQACLAAAMIAFVALRSALLLTLDNSEPRYTLEFFPILIVAGAALFAPSPTRKKIEA